MSTVGALAVILAVFNIILLIALAVYMDRLDEAHDEINLLCLEKAVLRRSLGRRNGHD